jgi:hypothetical protein
MKEIKRGFLLGIGLYLAIQFMGILGGILMYAISLLYMLFMKSGMIL